MIRQLTKSEMKNVSGGNGTSEIVGATLTGSGAFSILGGIVMFCLSSRRENSAEERVSLLASGKSMTVRTVAKFRSASRMQYGGAFGLVAGLLCLAIGILQLVDPRQIYS